MAKVENRLKLLIVFQLILIFIPLLSEAETNKPDNFVDINTLECIPTEYLLQCGEIANACKEQKDKIQQELTISYGSNAELLESLRLAQDKIRALKKRIRAYQSHIKFYCF